MEFENWALLTKGQEIIWQFGNIEDETKKRTIDFLNGLHKIGEDLFDKGIASVRFYSPNLLLGDELFIVNLEGSFFLIIFDPLSTIKIMAEQADKIPEEMDFLIRSVLIGQAAITYANLWSEANPEAGMHIDMLFKQALDEIIPIKTQQDMNVFVDHGTCSFAGLTTIQCLTFHFLLRRIFEIEYLNLIADPWAIIQDSSSMPVYLEHKSPKKAHLIAGYLTVVNEYVLDIFNTKLASMVFGSGELSSLDIVHGLKNFISISNPMKIFTDDSFLKNFGSVDSKIKNDIRRGLGEYLAKTYSEVQYQKFRQKKVEDILKVISDPTN
ncbi:MAG: hypothetical protein ACW981_00420 [Candidatus Hodarchaeales archaeon]|jgi:hypothetical protein